MSMRFVMQSQEIPGNAGVTLSYKIVHQIKFINMTPIFALTMFAMITFMAAIFFYLVQHVGRHDKAEESQTVTDDSVGELTIDHLAGIDRKKAA